MRISGDWIVLCPSEYQFHLLAFSEQEHHDLGWCSRDTQKGYSVIIFAKFSTMAAMTKRSLVCLASLTLNSAGCYLLLASSSSFLLFALFAFSLFYSWRLDTYIVSWRNMVQVAHLTPGPIAAFMTLQIVGGHIGMGIILCTIFFSSRVVRHPIFVNFCVTWILYALSYTFLWVPSSLKSLIHLIVISLYTGQIANPTPNFSLCLTQSAMIYAAPVMGGMSVFIFTLHVSVQYLGPIKLFTSTKLP